MVAGLIRATAVSHVIHVTDEMMTAEVGAVVETPIGRMRRKTVALSKAGNHHVTGTREAPSATIKPERNSIIKAAGSEVSAGSTEVRNGRGKTERRTDAETIGSVTTKNPAQGV